ncbi:hypothetical protein C8F04DRAFT_642365 [Mycena alexandri]|uniref:F-box domain-containing protein n=1 Tax=Mycena alexandri TaxID=1745969 RepID=A0AAD6TFK1_9AGAR|nr:hypothetical protein C8F04DRAFT_642365 [Mycena alexandri]
MSFATRTPPESAVTQEFMGNSDLVDEVLQYFALLPPRADADPTSRMHRRTLFSAALTCRTLREPALDVLWRHLKSVLPLLRLLPGFTTAVVDEESETSVYTLIGPLTPGDFRRFDHYGEKVLSLHYHPPPPDVVDPAAFMRIALVHSGPLLPRIQALRVISNPKDGPLILSLLSPSLRTLYVFSPLTFQDSNIGFLIIAPFLATAAFTDPPRMEDLSLHGLLPDAIWDIIPHFRNLRRLSLTGFSQRSVVMDLPSLLKGVNALSALKTLRALELRGVPATDEQLSLGQLDLSLPGLEQVTILASFDFVHDFVTGLDAPQLAILNLAFAAAPSAGWSDWRMIECWELLFDEISDKWESVLVELILCTGEYHGSWQFCNLFARMRRLHLQHFALSNYSAMTVTDDDVVELATTWPTLKHLVLAVWGPGVELPSVNCLVDLANHCPSLEFLKISLAMATEVTQRPAFRLDHPLRTLVLSHGSPIAFAEIQTFAEILDIAFPQLESLEGEETDAMNSLMQALRRARGRERRLLTTLNV